MHDDLRPSESDDLRPLQDLATRGTEDLRRFDAVDGTRLWQQIQAELHPERAAVPAAPTPARGLTGWFPISLAAAIALVVGVALGTTLTSPDEPDDATTLASVELAPLDDAVDAHTAVVRDGPDGRSIAVDLADLPTPDGFHEVWLLNPETGALVSLGPVRGDGAYAVPDSVDLRDLSVLDVSVEPQDGDPTHSGASVLRGEVRLTG